MITDSFVGVGFVVGFGSVTDLGPVRASLGFQIGQG